MAIDRNRLVQMFGELGRRLTAPATICVIGSTPGIVLGQPDRQSQDVDVWSPRSNYDETEFRHACEEIGVLYDPRTELEPEAIYIQVVRPGLVKLPQTFDVEVVGRYGSLTVTMPAPALLAAAKLARGEPRDIEDVAWWTKERALILDEIRAAISALPEPYQREAANENIVMVELFGSEGKK